MSEDKVLVGKEGDGMETGEVVGPGTLGRRVIISDPHSRPGLRPDPTGSRT